MGAESYNSKRGKGSVVRVKERHACMYRKSDHALLVQPAVVKTSCSCTLSLLGFLDVRSCLLDVLGRFVHGWHAVLISVLVCRHQGEGTQMQASDVVVRK